MRRKDREVTDVQEIRAIIDACDCMYLGLSDGEMPYVVPVNFGHICSGDRDTLYFHGALEGKKLDLIRTNPHVAFCMATGHELVIGSSAAAYSYRYASVMGTAKATILEEPEEKRRGLQCIFAHYEKDRPFEAPEQAVAATAVVQLEVLTLTAKRRV